MDLKGASINCERCGSEMKTNVGVQYSEWMSKARSEDKELHCSDCRRELSDPKKRHIKVNITDTDDYIEFSVDLINPTEAGVGFSLQNPIFEDEDQWDDMRAWSEAAKDHKGTVGFLTVINQSGDVVFEHEFKMFFSGEYPESQMRVGGNRTKNMSVKWLENGEKKTQSKQTNHTRYVSDPNTSPYDHSELTAVFTLEAIPRDSWNDRKSSNQIKL